MLAHCAAGLGLPPLLHRVLFKNQLTILMYHGVVRASPPVADWCLITREAFGRQMDYLSQRFEVLPLVDAATVLASGAIRCPTAAITFDNGYQNNFDVAFPILRERELPATIFLNTGLVGGDQTVWFGRLNTALARTDKKSVAWRNMHYDISFPAARAAAWQAALKELEHEELLRQSADLIETLGSVPDWPVEPQSPYRMLDRESIQTMADSGLIEFGAHTYTHTILTRVSPQTAREEIEMSVRAIQELTGKPCRVFAYPNGRAEDYDDKAMENIEKAGDQDRGDQPRRP